MNHLPPRNPKLVLECIRSTGIPPIKVGFFTSKPQITFVEHFTQITIVCGKTTLALADGNFFIGQREEIHYWRYRCWTAENLSLTHVGQNCKYCNSRSDIFLFSAYCVPRAWVSPVGFYNPARNSLAHSFHVFSGICVHIYLSICLSIYLSIYPSIYMYI